MKICLPKIVTKDLDLSGRRRFVDPAAGEEEPFRGQRNLGRGWDGGLQGVRADEPAWTHGLALDLGLMERFACADGGLCRDDQMS
jgi:hypothetical protein